MNTLWVILNEAKDSVIDVFETSDADSERHWGKFLKHRAGSVFCRRSNLNYQSAKDEHKWYVSYHYWDDMARWGYGEPTGVGWSACMAIPEPLKMLEFLE